MMNRREMLKTTLVAAGAVTFHQASLSAATRHLVLEAQLAHDPRRPQFHLLPKRNWMNDPNGPIYWNGKYHIFFQYNPNAAVWGNMHWAHAMSPDMVHWEHLPIALSPAPGGPDAAGCFSGAAVVNEGIVTVLYTGVVDTTVSHATVNDGQHLFRESQCLAISTDRELKMWKKRPQPVIASPPEGMQVTGFRDPSPWRSGDWWYVTVGSGIAHHGGCVLLYRSKDLQHWDYMHMLASGRGTGEKTANPVANGEMWECPELFPLEGKHVLIYSSMGKVHWQTGVLDEAAMKFHPERHGILDYGAYYAAKTQTDSQGRRIAWGWIRETRPKAEYDAAGWACMMSLPRVLRLRPDGELNIEVDAAVHQLRLDEQRLDPERDADMQLNQLHIAKATGELLARFTRCNKPFTVSLVGKLKHGEMAEPLVKLEYDPARSQQVIADGRAIPIAGDHKQPLDIHIYVDGSVAEVMLQGATAYTKRFYYAGDTAPDVRLRLDGPAGTLQSLFMWQMEPISADRLTT